MAIELWGTFSVRDHLEERAFVADVLLYDRIVVPTAPVGSDDKCWPTQWGLARQKRALEVLGDIGVAIPWTEARRQEWQTRFDAATRTERTRAKAQSAAQVQQDVIAARRKDLPYLLTRMLMADLSNKKVDDEIFRKLLVTEKLRPGSTVEAVCAFPSYNRFCEDVQVVDRSTVSPRDSAAASPSEIFGWEFFLPESTDQGERASLKLLAKAVALASNPEFIELRSQFYGWWRDVASAHLSIVEARADMERRFKDLRALMKTQRWKKTGRYAIKVLDAFSSGLCGIASEAAGAASETFFAGVDVVSERALADQGMPPRLKVAAMFHDARTRFGWKPPSDGR